MKTLKIETNKAGCRFALVAKDGAFAVYREAQNYAAHCRGGIAKTWRYVELGMTRDDAEALFARKIAGRVNP